jgi:DNA modification methylase
MARQKTGERYEAACACNADALPGTVLDPFLGSGTTTQAARKLGRRSIGIELNRAYEQVMRQRLGCPKGALISDVEFESGEATT